MMEQREIVEAELASHLLKQAVKVSIGKAKTGFGFETINEAAVMQNESFILSPVPVPGAGGREHYGSSRNASEIIAK